MPIPRSLIKRPATFERPLLNESQLAQLRDMAEKIKTTMKDRGPWDIELGFTSDRLWLFQIRPFVEKKNVHSLLRQGLVDVPVVEEGCLFLRIWLVGPSQVRQVEMVGREDSTHPQYPHASNFSFLWSEIISLK